MTASDHPIYRRRRALVLGIVGFLAEQDGPTPWDEVLDVFRRDDLSWKTLENVIRELENFGALHRVGKVDRRSDTRALLATPLGRAWLEQERLPLPGEDLEEVEAEEVDLEDAFAVADAIADVRAEISDLEAVDAFEHLEPMALLDPEAFVDVENGPDGP